ncbi:hypothetical protein [Hyalangium sp.]|uniref:hypothetical protein n=1 Tax=Hyalangium sp. TaxID=2028555 RepID=UPI002D6AB0AA|nr:hypothetical protein [Hyalangium sp.]HYI02212.1 hypothetical protein [Hyalangium sp.]
MSARTGFIPTLTLLLLAAAPAPAESASQEGTQVSEAMADAVGEVLPEALPGVEEPDASSSSAPSGYTPEAESVSPFRVSGYVDVGFAKAQGRGSSFHPDDTRVPADYGADAFAPAVNSRGDVASLDAGGRFVNGFLPRTVDIGGHASFLLNTASLDLFYEPSSAPVLVFARTQFLPRFEKGSGGTRLLLQQAFGRVTPFSGHELTVTVGRFDSVFGIEYRENESPLRTGITPSLMARYTTGHQLGVKSFYRRQLPSLSSAVSLNVAITNSSSRVESLQTADLSLTGLPFVSARLGYELQLLRLQLKLGMSGQTGARNDQDDAHVRQTQLGADARLTAGWFSLAAEYVRARDDAGSAPGKHTGVGDFFYASGFAVDGFYGTLALAVPVGDEALRTATVYSRYDRRAAEFHGFGGILTSRYTVGTRLDFWSVLSLKAEYLFNRENAGAPRVDNDVFTASAIYVF